MIYEYLIAYSWRCTLFDTVYSGIRTLLYTTKEPIDSYQRVDQLRSEIVHGSARVRRDGECDEVISVSLLKTVAEVGSGIAKLSPGAMGLTWL